MPRVRMNFDAQTTPPGLNAEPAHAELIFGSGTALATGANPAATALLSALGANMVVAGAAHVNTVAVATGITIVRPGVYDVELNIPDHSEASASGNVQFDVLKNAAAFATTQRMQAISLALTTKEKVTIRKRQTLAKGDIITASVTSAAGGVVTVTEGVLRVTQLTDLIGSDLSAAY